MSRSQKQIDWDAVAAAYDEGSLTLKQISEAYNVSTSAITRRARQEGWPPRSRKTKRKTKPDATFEARLARALDRQISELEERWASDEALASSAQAEKEARTLNVLIRTAEKLKELEMAKTKSTGSKRDKDKSKGDELDRKRLRETLERRLDKLLAAADARGVSPESDSGGN